MTNATMIDGVFKREFHKREMQDENEAVITKLDLRWLLRCAQDSIENCYSEGAPRRIEMNQMTCRIGDQLGVWDDEDGDFDNQYISIKELVKND